MNWLAAWANTILAFQHQGDELEAANGLAQAQLCGWIDAIEVGDFVVPAIAAISSFIILNGSHEVMIEDEVPDGH